MQNRLHQKLFFLLLLGIAVWACNSPESPKENQESHNAGITKSAVRDQARQTLPGADAETLTAANKTDEKMEEASSVIQPYAWHIPAGSDPGKKVPVIFIFDPHARGNMPVAMYRDLADEFGFVLVGSNESMNSQPIGDGLKYYHEMKSAISGEVEIDGDRIYTMGFSGGARVAVSIAIQEDEVQGVVGCGAGFPAVSQIPQPDFYYFGMIGYEDFNLGELLNNDRLLTRSGFTNELMIFDGGHDWPAEAVMREAFQALEIDHMSKSGTRKQSVINQTIAYYNAAIDDLKSENRYFDAAEMADRAASVLGRVINVDDFKSQMRSFKKNPLYHKDLSAMVKSLERESGLQTNFIAAFQDKDISWWQAEIISLKSPAQDIFDQRLNKRLESFVGLMAYMQSKNAIAGDDLGLAQKCLDIYRLIEPLNPEHFYLGAVMSMKQGDEDAAATYLEQAVALGFNNVDRIEHEAAFDGFSKKEKIIASIQGAP